MDNICVSHAVITKRGNAPFVSIDRYEGGGGGCFNLNNDLGYFIVKPAFGSSDFDCQCRFTFCFNGSIIVRFGPVVSQ